MSIKQMCGSSSTAQEGEGACRKLTPRTSRACNMQGLCLGLKHYSKKSCGPFTPPAYI